MIILEDFGCVATFESFFMEEEVQDRLEGTVIFPGCGSPFGDENSESEGRVVGGAGCEGSAG